MARLVIENLDEDVIARLEERAAARSQSLAQAVKEIILGAVPARTEASSAFRRIRSMTPPGPQQDSTAVIRQMRDDKP